MEGQFSVSALALYRSIIKMEETFVNILKVLLRPFLCGFYM